MATVFIDANIYLAFYDEKYASLRALLRPLRSIRREIFVTEQIVNEVDRRKLNVFLDYTKRFDSKFSLNLPLPSLSHDRKNDRKWGERLTRVNVQIKKLQDQFNEARRETARKISDSNDFVSESLHELFASAASPTTEQIERARKRKDLGWPPGKHDGPVGDQISWEQFLSQLKVGQSVWIVTRDSDFVDDVSGERKLKPPLQKELKKKIGNTAGIHCFTDLLQAIEHYKAHSGQKVTNFPSKATIKKIEKEAAQEPHPWLLPGATYGSGAPMTFTFTPARSGAPLHYASAYGSGSPGWGYTPQFGSGIHSSPFGGPFTLYGSCPICGSSFVEQVPGTVGPTVWRCNAGHTWV